MKYRAWMLQFKAKYLKAEGSLTGLCWDACFEMKIAFPELIWYEGWVILPVKENSRGKSWHNWMESKSGVRYDPTREQFGRILKYRKVKKNR